MMHSTRTHRVSDVAELRELAEKLATRVWPLCTGFRHGWLLLLNDATSEDGAQEYAVFHEGSGRQIESLTCAYTDSEKLVETIQEILAGKNEIAQKALALGDADQGKRPKLDKNVQHTCRFCA